MCKLIYQKVSELHYQDIDIKNYHTLAVQYVSENKNSRSNKDTVTFCPNVPTDTPKEQASELHNQDSDTKIFQDQTNNLLDFDS